MFCQQHQELIQKHDKVENHPWFGIAAHDLSPIDQGDLVCKLWKIEVLTGIAFSLSHRLVFSLVLRLLAKFSL